MESTTKALIFDCFGVLALIKPSASSSIWGSGMEINYQLLDFIKKQLKPQYKIGMLSNVNFDWPAKNLNPEERALFDEVGLSYQLGRAKPEVAVYETMANRLGVLPAECLFIDDSEFFCQVAEEVGMKAVHFKGTDQAISDIKEHLNA